MGTLSVNAQITTPAHPEPGYVYTDIGWYPGSDRSVAIQRWSSTRDGREFVIRHGIGKCQPDLPYRAGPVGRKIESPSSVVTAAIDRQGTAPCRATSSSGSGIARPPATKRRRSLLETTTSSSSGSPPGHSSIVRWTCCLRAAATNSRLTSIRWHGPFSASHGNSQEQKKIIRCLERKRVIARSSRAAAASGFLMRSRPPSMIAWLPRSFHH